MIVFGLVSVARAPAVAGASRFLRTQRRGARGVLDGVARLLPLLRRAGCVSRARVLRDVPARQDGGERVDRDADRTAHAGLGRPQEPAVSGHCCHGEEGVGVVLLDGLMSGSLHLLFLECVRVC